MIKLFFGLFLLSTYSHADILFLNFNGNNSSIIEAREAARIRGEKLIVYPDTNITALSPDSLKKIFSELKMKNTTLTTVIFSGHDGGGDFSGKLGDAGRADFKEAIEYYPEAKKTIKSLMLRGCYSATIDQVASDEMGEWRWILPKVQFISGYNQMAPSSKRPQSKSFVKNMLLLEMQLRETSDLNKLVKDFEAIPYINETAASVWFKHDSEMCSLPESKSGLYLATDQLHLKNPVLTISELMNQCQSNLKELKNNVNEVWKYYYGDETHIRPPHDFHESRLRTAYSDIRINLHCLRLVDSKYVPDEFADMVVRLVYFDNIVSNFLDDFPPSNIALILNKYRENGKILRFPNLKIATRKEIGDFIHQATTLSETIENTNDKDLLSDYILHMEYSVYRLDADIVPFEWVTNPHSKEKLNEKNLE